MWYFSSGAFLGWGLGANDAANVMGTGVAANLVKYRTAVCLVAVFVIVGAVVEGPKVMNTVGSLAKLDINLAFLAALSAGLVMFIMSGLALPISASQAIVGALIAIGLANGTAEFSLLRKVVLCWILTPIGAAVISGIAYRLLGFLLKPVLSDVTLRTVLLRIAIVVAGRYGSYALGGTNVANVSGVYVGAGYMSPLGAALFGGFFIALGVLTYSKKVMMTVGRDIFPLDSFTAFVAVLSQAITAHIFTQIGVPVSSSQAIVGAVIGIGLVKNMNAISGKIVARILFGWIATPVVAGAMCYALLILSGFFRA